MALCMDQLGQKQEFWNQFACLWSQTTSKQVSTFDIQLFELDFYPLGINRWRSWAQLTWPTPAQMVVESRSRDFPVEWTQETFSSPNKPDDNRRVHDRVTKMAADHHDAAAQSASLSEVRTTLLR